MAKNEIEEAKTILRALGYVLIAPNTIPTAKEKRAEMELFARNRIRSGGLADAYDSMKLIQMEKEIAILERIEKSNP